MTGLLLLIGMSVGAFVISGIFSDGDESDPASQPDPSGLQIDADGEAVFSSDYENILTTVLDDEAFDSVSFVDGAMKITTGNLDDVVAGGSGDDTLALGAGNDAAIGGAGDDVVDLGAGDDQYGQTGTQTAIDPVFGNTHLGDDVVSGGAGDDEILDYYGSNTLSGGDGNDVLGAIDALDEAAVTPDQLDGGNGNDIFVVDQGDTVITGAGNDEVRVDVGGSDDLIAGVQAVTITDFDVRTDALRLSGAISIEDLRVEDFTDGTGATVYWNNIELVRVEGGQGLSLSDILIATS